MWLPVESIKGFHASHHVEIIELINIAQSVLNARTTLDVNLSNNGSENKEAMLLLLSVGTSDPAKSRDGIQ